MHVGTADTLAGVADESCETSLMNYCQCVTVRTMGARLQSSSYRLAVFIFVALGR